MQNAAARRKAQAPQAGVEEVRGLCVTCRNAETCTFPRDPQRPVMQCEEFEGLTSRVIPFPIEAVRPVTEETEVSPLRGLCRNCDQRATCTYHKPAGGVWHCEEYC